MSFNAKLRLLSLVTLCGLIVILLVTLLGIRSIDDKHGAALRRATYVADLVEIKASALSTIMLDPTQQETREVFAAAEKNILAHGKIAHDMILRDKLKDDLDKLLAAWTAYDGKSQEIIKLAETNAKLANERITPLYNSVFKPFQAELERFIAARQEESKQASAEAAQNSRSMFWIIVVLLVLVSVVNVAALVVFSASLKSKLAHLKAALLRLQGGDLTQRLPSSGKDELDELADSVNAFVGSLQGIVQRTRDRSNRLADAAHRLSESSSHALQSAQAQSDASASVAAAVEELSVSIDHVAHNATEAESKAALSGELAQGSGAEAQGAIRQMKSIEGVVGDAATRMHILEEQATGISNIIHVIKEVAEQTNLLALNAAIEAARAGEQGRGFAVVADEVRKLAERTASSTEEITGMVNSIQARTKEATDIMRQGTGLVTQGVNGIEQVGAAMQEANESSSSVVGAIAEISGALKEQREAGTAIAKSVELIANDSEKQRAVSAEVAASSQQLEALAAELLQEVAVFSV